MFNVVINAPGRDPRSVQCMHRECGIGRDDANLVMLQGWSIASKHASLVREDDGVYILSLGGKAPITVNGPTCAPASTRASSAITALGWMPGWSAGCASKSAAIFANAT